MDEIQKILVKAGRKDLAQKYYLKVAGFESHLENALETLGINRSFWDLERKGSKNILKISDYTQKMYEKLSADLQPDFNTKYNRNFDGLEFLTVKTLFGPQKF